MADLTPEALAAGMYQAAAAVLGQSPEGSLLAWECLDPEAPTRRRFLAAARTAMDRLASPGQMDRLQADFDTLNDARSKLLAKVDRWRPVLEKLATPIDVTARDEGWLHDHGEDCEFDGCDAAELHYRITLARQALEVGQ